jgi:hypothetical protein
MMLAFKCNTSCTIGIYRHPTQTIRTLVGSGWHSTILECTLDRVTLVVISQVTVLTHPIHLITIVVVAVVAVDHQVVVVAVVAVAAVVVAVVVLRRRHCTFATIHVTMSVMPIV